VSERAWPFEGKAEAGGHIRTPSDFVAAHGEGVEAVVVRIGLHDAQLVLVDGEGRWQRWVYRSVEVATDAAESLRIPVHVGEYPEELRVRMGGYRRPPEDFDRAPYPEQGHVGPVLSYPENRPRRVATKTDSRPQSE
jgi:hypothetical protein